MQHQPFTHKVQQILPSPALSLSSGGRSQDSFERLVLRHIREDLNDAHRNSSYHPIYESSPEFGSPSSRYRLGVHAQALSPAPTTSNVASTVNRDESQLFHSDEYQAAVYDLENSHHIRHVQELLEDKVEAGTSLNNQIQLKSSYSSSPKRTLYPSCYDAFGSFILTNPRTDDFVKSAFQAQEIHSPITKATYQQQLHTTPERKGAANPVSEFYLSGNTVVTSPTLTSRSGLNKSTVRDEDVSRIAAEVFARQEQLTAAHGGGPRRKFRPSHTALLEQGLAPELQTQRAILSQELIGHTNYAGDITNERNRSADIPDNQNCSLWVLGLPSDVTYTCLLGAIRNVGKIYATVINPPVGKHPTAAAKIVLFSRADAERLKALADSGNFIVMGHVIRDIRWNKIKVPAHIYTEESRVVKITGEDRFMDVNILQELFRQRFTYDIDKIVEVPCLFPGCRSQEWHFGSLRCQALNAYLFITRELDSTYQIEYAPDPCQGPPSPK
ncbi:hypothetical protein F5884DRAFT_423672 [Xylogone sp. PMI_703]|nr:hypothetical protein F5884DRAFT_423672 [Xylogone sp. PMI_703]